MTNSSSVRDNRGFTLIELMIVVVIIAVVAAIALPNLLSARLSANETAVIATMREIISAQAQFQGRGLADADDDGVGEYGTFAELAGTATIRNGSVRLNPIVLASSMGSINASGEVARNGYQFRMWLPGAGGTGLGELANGGAPTGIDTDLGETTWCCYAWPSNYETTGYRTFFVNQGGELIATAAEAYSGPGAVTNPGSALRAGGNIDSVTGALATGATGRDGNFWKAVQD